MPVGRRRELLVVAAAAACSSLAVLVSTRHGIGVTHTDSVAYLTMVDDVAAGRMPYPSGNGVSFSPTHFPPGWSLVAALIVALVPGIDALAAARALNVVLAGLLPIAVYVAVRSRSTRPTWIPPLMAVVVATSYPLMELASRALSEAQFLVLMVIALLAIERVARVRSMASLFLASVLVAALTLTRFVGIAALLPLCLAVFAITPRWVQRLTRLGFVALITVVPTLVWYLLEPGSSENFHLKGDQRAGLEQLLHSVREAGVTLVRGDRLGDAVHFLTGLALLAAPIVAILVTSRSIAPSIPWRRRTSDFVASRELGPWVWFVLAYSAMVVVQRWLIDREVIARYWLPFWIVTVVVVGRCLIDLAALERPTCRRAVRLASASLLALAAYNLAAVAVTVRSNARDGVTLNAVRYQESETLDALADADLGVIYTDNTYLVEFQMYARGVLVPIERLSCQVPAIDALVEELESATRGGTPPAIALLRRCRREGAFVDELLDRLDGAIVVRDEELGIVIRPQ